MNRYFIEVAYKGTQFGGFQKQENAFTIQGELEKALTTFYRTPFNLTGSSRTDAGVHALQNFFHVDTEVVFQSKAIYNINALLHPDIVVKAFYSVSANQHCRFDAISRQYQYKIIQYKNPFLSPFAYYYPYPLDLQVLNSLAEQLLEHKTYKAFSKKHTQVNNFNCTVLHAKWHAQKEAICFDIEGNRFLRGMVRALVATMLEVSKAKDPQKQFKSLLEENELAKANFATPAAGLTLQAVNFAYELNKMS